MNIEEIKKVHFIGVGGIGISAIAKMMLDLEKTVSGSDMAWNELIKDLEDKGLIFKLGHKAENIPADADLVIYSAAVPPDNPERQKAKELKIKELSYPEFLGELSRKRKTIAISGANGKTTTTALTGLVLEAGGLDPLVIVGSKVKAFKEGNLRLGGGEYFVVEACEYKANFLNLEPKVIILTNIEADHLDYYRDIDHIFETFQIYVNKIPKDGFLILNADDPLCMKLERPECHIVTYGIKNKADVMAANIRVKEGRQYFNLICSGCEIEKNFILRVPGVFNIYNALAAIACGMELGVDLKVIRKAIENFSGTWRRFEIIEADEHGYLRGFTPKITLISDYAHHPTAVRGTIKAAKEFYPGRRLVAVFEPHQHNRTKNLFKEFVGSFDEANLVILSEIYEVAGREAEEDQDVSSMDLVREIKKQGVEAIYGENLEKTKKLILENIKEGDVVLIMGAGDIYRIGEELGRMKYEVRSMKHEA